MLKHRCGYPNAAATAAAPARGDAAAGRTTGLVLPVWSRGAATPTHAVTVASATPATREHRGLASLARSSPMRRAGSVGTTVTVMLTRDGRSDGRA
jgi:hypothetical protein